MQLQRQKIDDHTREYYSRQKLTNKRIEAASSGDPPDVKEEMTGVNVSVAMGMAGTIIDPFALVENALLAALVAIPGVETAILAPYMARVTKARMFEWEEIEPEIMRLMASFNLSLEASKLKGE